MGNMKKILFFAGVSLILFSCGRSAKEDMAIKEEVIELFDKIDDAQSLEQLENVYSDFKNWESQRYEDLDKHEHQIILEVFNHVLRNRKEYFNEGNGHIRKAVGTQQTASDESGISPFFEAESKVKELTKWSYDSQKWDEDGEGDYCASILSLNYFPQEDYNLYLMLSLLYTPDPAVETKRILAGVALYALDVKPQYSSNTAYVLVKFDDGEFEKWEGGLIRSGRFFVFNNSDDFIVKLKKTKKCVVSTSPRSSFVFNTQGLQWNY